jgi:hypothetical protein
MTPAGDSIMETSRLNLVAIYGCAAGATVSRDYSQRNVVLRRAHLEAGAALRDRAQRSDSDRRRLSGAAFEYGG